MEAFIFVSISHQKDLTQGKWHEGRFIVGVKVEEGRVRAEARALPVYAGHQLTLIA